jgi:hypothetical protein
MPPVITHIQKTSEITITHVSPGFLSIFWRKLRPFYFWFGQTPESTEKNPKSTGQVGVFRYTYRLATKAAKTQYSHSIESKYMFTGENGFIKVLKPFRTCGPPSYPVPNLLPKFEVVCMSIVLSLQCVLILFTLTHETS